MHKWKLDFKKGAAAKDIAQYVVKCLPITNDNPDLILKTTKKKKI